MVSIFHSSAFTRQVFKTAEIQTRSKTTQREENFHCTADMVTKESVFAIRAESTVTNYYLGEIKPSIFVSTK